MEHNQDYWQGQIDARLSGIEKELHSVRVALDNLTRWKAKILGASSVAIVVGSGIVTWVSQLFLK